MLKVRTAVVNGTFNKDHTTAERWARRPFRMRHESPRLWTVSTWFSGRSMSAPRPGGDDF
jgi:hypothetical protein